MTKEDKETRSTLALVVAIVIAVLVTVWLILSFDEPNDRDNRGRQTENSSNLLFYNSYS